MIRTAILKNWTMHLRGQGISIILSLSLTIGLLYGVLLIRNDGQFGEELLSFTAGQAASEGRSIFSAFLNAFLSLFCFLLIPYICGFCNRPDWCLFRFICEGAGCRSISCRILFTISLAGYWVLRSCNNTAYRFNNFNTSARMQGIDTHI